MNHTSSWRNLFKIVILLLAIGFVQTPLLVNVQLLIKYPRLIPDFSFYNPIIDILTTLIASLYLLGKWKYFGSRDWLVGFVCLLASYALLKNLGVYYDHTAYKIAQATGITIGGGAAMAHVPLFLALMGPLQLVSLIGFHLSGRLTKLRENKQ